MSLLDVLRAPSTCLPQLYLGGCNVISRLVKRHPRVTGGLLINCCFRVTTAVCKRWFNQLNSQPRERPNHIHNNKQGFNPTLCLNVCAAVLYNICTVQKGKTYFQNITEWLIATRSQKNGSPKMNIVLFTHFLWKPNSAL